MYLEMWTLWNKIYLIKTVLEYFMKWGLKEGISMMQILGLLGMYFDAVVVEVEKYFPFFQIGYGHTANWHLI